jgi:hypothetical protein
VVCLATPASTRTCSVSRVTTSSRQRRPPELPAATSPRFRRRGSGARSPGDSSQLLSAGRTHLPPAYQSGSPGLLGLVEQDADVPEGKLRQRILPRVDQGRIRLRRLQHPTIVALGQRLIRARSTAAPSDARTCRRADVRHAAEACTVAQADEEPKHSRGAARTLQRSLETFDALPRMRYFAGTFTGRVSRDVAADIHAWRL